MVLEVITNTDVLCVCVIDTHTLTGDDSQLSAHGLVSLISYNGKIFSALKQ